MSHNQQKNLPVFPLISNNLFLLGSKASCSILYRAPMIVWMLWPWNTVNKIVIHVNIATNTAQTHKVDVTPFDNNLTYELSWKKRKIVSKKFRQSERYAHTSTDFFSNSIWEWVKRRKESGGGWHYHDLFEWYYIIGNGDFYGLSWIPRDVGEFSLYLRQQNSMIFYFCWRILHSLPLEWRRDS